tara:strand:+ start:1357 stop:1776 length:420 start_codon:yes stop_codon:yes gene_type:complete
MIKGTIYKISNHTKNTCYIGSTEQKQPKKRYYRHRTDKDMSRYQGLFDDDPKWEILCQVDLNNKTELRELEQFFINIHSNCINKNWSFVPEHLKKERERGQRRNYNHTDKGKEKRKWQSYRHNNRNKINKAIIKYFSKV